ncbi:MAG: hypothetical protein K2J63_11285, partial [Muribaculaceae bacterium]|nr:hypothetical protein [Muribaculaceae bacterium]
ADKGYSQENGLLYVYDANGAGHNEWYWQQRVKIPLKFLLSKYAIEGAGIDDVVTDSIDLVQSPMLYDIKGNSYHTSDMERLPEGIYIYKGRRIIKNLLSY